MNFDLDEFEKEYNELFDEYNDYVNSCEGEVDEATDNSFKERFRNLDRKLNILIHKVSEKRTDNLIKVIFGGKRDT